MDSFLPDTSFDSEKFFKALDRALVGLLQRRQAGNFARMRYAYDPEWKKAYKAVHAYIDEQVNAALDATTPKEDELDPEEPPRKHVLLHELAKQIRDPIDLRYQMLGVFLPARDTTSILVSNALFHLARNPKIWNDLRKIALEVDLERLTLESLKSLVPFRYVLFETPRLQGPSGRANRQATRNTVLPRGGGEDGQSPILVTKGTGVSGNLWAMHHDSDLFGHDVHIFNPDRWIGKRPMWEFVPFLGGPRVCPANQQVLTHASYTLLHLTREFSSIENRDSVLSMLN